MSQLNELQATIPQHALASIEMSFQAELNHDHSLDDLYIELPHLGCI
jgi:hypothetical protein